MLVAHVRTGAWRTGVVAVSALVGLIVAAAVWTLVHGGGNGAARFVGLPGPAAGRFTPAALVTAARVPRGVSITAHVHAHQVVVYRHPDGRGRPRIVRALRQDGKPLALIALVRRTRPGWLEIELPVRPNLSFGWIRSRHVSLHSDPFRVEVALGAHHISVWERRRLIASQPIGVGLAVSPTPAGRYYLTDLLRPPDPHGLYGPYAFGLSAYSNVLTTFAGGDGQIGLHGTDDPSGLGHGVSHGCIRVSNATIIRLAKLLPIGTPVLIRR